MVKDKVEVKTRIEAAKEAKKTFDNIRRCPKCGRKNADLTITDVPTKALNQFKKLANEEFKAKGSSAHYGFTLKHLLDFYFGKITEHSLIAEAKADEAIKRIESIESALGAEQGEIPEQKNPKVIKMLDGTEKRCF